MSAVFLNRHLMVLPSPTSCSVLHFNLGILRDSLQRIVPCDIIARLQQLDSSLHSPHTLVCFMQNHDSAVSNSSVSLRRRNLSPSSFLGLTIMKPFPPVAFHSGASAFIQLNLHFHKLEPFLSRVFVMEAPFPLSPLVALICLPVASAFSTSSLSTTLDLLKLFSLSHFTFPDLSFLSHCKS